MNNYEPANPDYVGYPDEPVEEIELLNWSAYLDDNAQWVEVENNDE